MNKQFLPVFWAAVFMSLQSNAQLHLSVQQIRNSDVWGVFVKPSEGHSPSVKTITASGKITLVTNKEADISALISHAGSWRQYLIARSPEEAPEKNYFSFIFTQDLPQIFYHESNETLLFSFRLTDARGIAPYIMDNANDVFNHLPNTMGVKPGNELIAFDFGEQPAAYLEFSGVYLSESPKNNGTAGTILINKLAEPTLFTKINLPEEVQSIPSGNIPGIQMIPTLNTMQSSGFGISLPGTKDLRLGKM
jgi:hypothetical protein